ncbi:MAG: acetyl-CoA carboxylase biotin carboxyl carrier protein [Planctomycetaceae bacterium]|jgi:acetyl-CoA carboxylase biotin carboxyl carrier protein|nr:acetyl-CoA carboxylase biotin carboxyl carrier protein [Planctomycetaceae bacterium]
MADQPNGDHDVFDIRRIESLVAMMRDNNIAEVDIQQGDMRIQLKSNVSCTASAILPQQPMMVPSPVAVSQVAVSQPTAGTSSAVEDESKFTFVKSPMVGTFYASPNPDSPPFVQVGDSIGPETTVCILEAMKVFNEIAAECSGKIVAVLVKNGEPVEFGKPLFKIDPKG